jgi:hypothetical protein
MRRALLAFALAIPGAAEGQLAASGRTPEAMRARLQRQIDAPTFASVSTVIDAASSRGLPAEPLLNKALELSVRKLSGTIIRSSVEKLAARLDSASRALAPAGPEDIGAGAEALGQNIPASTLTAIRKLRPNGPIYVELGVLTQLVASKVPVAKASEMVANLIREGMRPADILAVGTQVGSDVEGGMDPEQAFRVRARGVLVGSGGVAASAAADNREASLGAVANTPPGNTNTGTNRANPPRRTPRKP